MLRSIILKIPSDMNKSTNLKQVTRRWTSSIAFALTVPALVPLAFPAYAQKNERMQPPTVDLSSSQISAARAQVVKKINAIHDSKSIILVLYHPHLVDPPRDEAVLLEYGCKFTVTDANQIASLEQIIRDAEIKLAQHPKTTITPVTGIYVTGENGDVTTILVNDTSDRVKTTEGSLDHMMITLNTKAIYSLYARAAKIEMPSYCGDFLQKYHG